MKVWVPPENYISGVLIVLCIKINCRLKVSKTIDVKKTKCWEHLQSVLYKNIISMTFKVMKTSGKSTFLHAKPSHSGKEKKSIICFRTFSGTLKGFIDKVCCVQEFLLSALPIN